MEIQTKRANPANYAADSVRKPHDIRYVVVHYTGNDGDSARANAQYFATAQPGVSAHYFVDAQEIWNSVPEDCVAWHCGTRGMYYHAACRNRNAIGVELCAYRDAKGRFCFREGTLDHAAALLRELMTRYAIPVENVLRHYDVTHKCCPEPFVRDADAWVRFQKRLKGEEDMTIYKTWADIPDWARNTVAKLTRKGFLRGDNGYLNLEHNALRNLVINDRAGVYGV